MGSTWHPDADELVANTQFLRRLARRLVATEAAAEDLVQDTFAAALTAKLPPRDSLRKWLAGVARNLARMGRRSAARRQQHERAVLPLRSAADPVEIAQRLEMEERVVRALRSLPDPYGSTLVLRFRDDLDAPAIAKLTGVTASTVRTRVQRGLALLREQLDGDVGREKWSAALLPLLATGPPSGPLLATGAAMILTKKTLVLAALALVAVLLFWGWSAWRQSEEGPGSRRERSAAGGPKADEESNAPDASPPTSVRAPADRDLDLFGEVVDADGAPIPNALVRTASHPWRRAHALLAETHAPVSGPETRTLQDGTFRLRLRRGQLVDLEISAEGYAAVAVPECQAGEQVRVALTRTAAVTVRVRDEAGAPLGNATVTVWRPRAGRRPVFTASAQTGADGRCVVGGLTPGSAMLRVEDTEPVACDVPGVVEFVMPTVRTITGLVRDAESGTPIEGARVGADWQWKRSATTDANGRFAWAGVGARELHASAPGYGCARALVPPIGALDFELARGDSVEGRVIDRAGQPISGAYVVAMASLHTDTGQEIDTRSARTAADGTFRVESLRHDLPHTLIVHADGHAKQLVDVAPSPDGPGLIVVGDIMLPAPRSLEGRVLTEAGAPVVACTVVVESTAKHHLDSYYGAREERRTDDLGRFRFPELAAGAYTVEATVLGREPVEGAVTIPEERDVHNMELIVKDGRVLTVMLTGEDGVPAPDVHIAVDGQQRHEAQTDEQGRAVLHEVPDGDVMLRFWPGQPGRDDERGWLAGGTPAIAGQIEVRAVLRVTRPIRGVALAPGNEPLPAMIVQAVGGDDEPLAQAICDERGRFTLFVQPGTQVDLLVDGSGRTGGPMGPLHTIDVLGVAPGVTAPAKDVTIRTGTMPEDRALTVRVVDLNGKAAAGFEVVLHYANTYPRPDPQARRTTTDAQGRAVFNGLPRRRVRIEVERSDALPDSAVVPRQEVLLPHGQQIELSFRRGAEFRFVFKRPDETPIAGVEVRLRTMAGVALATGSTNADGAVTLYGVPDEAHQIYAAYEGADGVTREIHRHDLRPTAQPVPLRFDR